MFDYFIIGPVSSVPSSTNLLLVNESAAPCATFAVYRGQCELSMTPDILSANADNMLGLVRLTGKI